MKLKELRDKLNSLSDKELESDVIVVSKYTDTIIEDVEILKENLYYDYSDDPCELIRESELEHGEEYDIYIEKGTLILKSY